MEIDNGSRLVRSRQVVAGLCWCLAMWFLTTSSPLAAKGMKPLEIKQRYVTVLGVLATGDFDRALTDLLELEQAAVGEDRTWRYVDTLWRSKLQVIRDLLAAPGADLLMPIIVLHHDAYFRYSEMDRRYLAQHSRTMSGELAEIFAERRQTGANAFAGWILTSFASYLSSPSNIGMSADLFYRAHLADAGNGRALTGVAAAWERSGAYDKAIETLIKALRQEPGDPELSLRLAMCELRSADGSRQQALDSLGDLTQAETPSWMRSIAYQELARARLEDDGPGAAETILRAGLEQLPGDQQLSLQLAAVLDRQRRRSEAMAVLEGIEILGWQQESARQTYDFWQPPDLTAVRSELHQEMTAGQQDLATGLRTFGAAGAGP